MMAPPDEYNKVNIVHLDRCGEMIQKILLDYPTRKFSTIMDIGCGSGNVTNSLRAQIPHEQFLALDKNPAMIEFAIANNTLDPEKITYATDDFAKPWVDLCPEIKYFEGKVDLAFSNYAIHWMCDIPTAMENLGRLLKPGGVFYFSAVGVRPLADVLPESVKYLKLGTIQSQMDGMVAAIINAGLKVTRRDGFADRWQCKTEHEYKTLMKYLPKLYLCLIGDNYWKSIDIEERERVTGEVAKAASQVYCVDNGIVEGGDNGDLYRLCFDGFRVQGFKEE